MTERTDDHENREALDLLMRGFQVSRMIRLVADLEIADKIGEVEDRDLNELATACAVQSAPLLRVLRTLAAFGIFRVSVDGRISHSPVAATAHRCAEQHASWSPFLDGDWLLVVGDN